MLPQSWGYPMFLVSGLNHSTDQDMLLLRERGEAVRRIAVVEADPQALAKPL
jgi:hypothetical protein